MKKLGILIIALMLLAIPASPAQAESSATDVFTPERINSRSDLLRFSAIETDISPKADWRFSMWVPSRTVQYVLTSRGRYEYGVELDYNKDGISDIRIRSNYDNSVSSVFDRESVVVETASTNTQLCQGEIGAGSVMDGIASLKKGYVVNLYYVSLSVPKSCLPEQPDVALFAYAADLEAGVVDLVPDTGRVTFRQPWIEQPLSTFSAAQRTLASFSSTATTLTNQQRAQVEAAVEANPNATKFICTGIRYVSQPMSENIKVRKRAKAACDYAKTLNPELSTWYQNKPTEARSYAGKVLLTIKSPAN